MNFERNNEKEKEAEVRLTRTPSMKKQSRTRQEYSSGIGSVN